MSQDREEMEIENNSWREFCECISICLWILSDPCRVLIISPVASEAADSRCNAVISLWQRDSLGPPTTYINSSDFGHSLRGA
jgi:hypothetical protein